LIFKGHLPALYPQGAFARLLSQQGVFSKDIMLYAQEVIQQIKQHAEQIPAEAVRPYRDLQRAKTARNGQSKESPSKS